MKDPRTPPVVILGGGSNALSVARSLGRRGIRVYSINLQDEPVRYSRFCKYIRIQSGGDLEAAWANFLTSEMSENLLGSVLLAASDAGIRVIAHNRERLAERFILDDSDPEAQLCMLNKLSTYRKAVECGVCTPRFWVASSREEVQRLGPELVFPLLVKPQLSHVFESRFGKKFIVARNLDELVPAFELTDRERIATLLVEQIPGPDDLLCSYYTYMGPGGSALFDFTKRIIRRFPENMGPGSYHVTDWNPEVRDEALKLFRHVGLRGLANAEFKRDRRDGRLKLIECNARFTAANRLVASAGLDLAGFVYDRIVNRIQLELGDYKKGLHMWDPLLDAYAFRELRRNNRLSVRRWAKSLAHRQILPYFDWSDPLPSLANLRREVRNRL